MSEHSIRWINNKPHHYRTILYLGRPSSPLARNLYHALAGNGALSMSLHPDSRLISSCTSYDCYVLDADYLGEIGVVMWRILTAQPDARILVVSNHYDWRDAAQAFNYGAIDVIRQPLNRMATYHALQMVMKQSLPRPRRNSASVN